MLRTKLAKDGDMFDDKRVLQNNNKEAYQMPEKEFEIIDLFCGAGGLSLGFKEHGFKVVKAYDNDSVAVENFNVNVANVAECADLNKISIDEIPDVKGIIGGPPCQGFSIAGKRDVNDERSLLSVRFTEIMSGKTPTWFVMENVDGMLSMSSRHFLHDRLASSGYDVEELILDARDFGAPQIRKRLFFIGARRDINGLMVKKAIEGINALKEERKNARMTVRDFLKKYEYPWYYRHPRTYGRRAVYSVDEPSPTIRTVNRPMPPNYRRHPNDAKYVEGKVRALTEEERALLQTFPPTFKWIGNISEKRVLIGNAVPPYLAGGIAYGIKHMLKS
ncbi:Modification methylase HaeIII [subsurface metagenome]